MRPSDVLLTSSMMMEGFLAPEADLKLSFSLAAEGFLFLDRRSVNVEPFLARVLASGTVYTFGFWATSLGTAEAFLFFDRRSWKMDPFLFWAGSSGAAEGFLSLLLLNTLWNQTNKRILCDSKYKQTKKRRIFSCEGPYLIRAHHMAQTSAFSGHQVLRHESFLCRSSLNFGLCLRLREVSHKSQDDPPHGQWSLRKTRKMSIVSWNNRTQYAQIKDEAFLTEITSCHSWDITMKLSMHVLLINTS